jgi:hypothetical protein
MKPTPTKNQKAIYKLLTTSTGSHMCDSGGAYWRHWQRNQQRTIDDFINEPDVQIGLTTYDYYHTKDTPSVYRATAEYTHDTYFYDPREDRSTSTEYEYTISIFHWLDRYFDLVSTDPFVQKFNRLRRGSYQYMEDRQDAYLESIWYTKGDIYNSCNWDSNLSQVYTLTPVYPEGIYPDFYDIKYYLLSIHQGCDVRGGYTTDIMVRIDQDDYPREDVWWQISYSDNPEHTIPVSNTYDWYRIRFDDSDEVRASNYNADNEIDTENIAHFNLNLS